MTTPQPNIPERRSSDELTSFRLTQVEKRIDETNHTLNGLDTKFDNLRADLFERSVFVTLQTLELQLLQRDNKITALELAAKEVGEAHNEARNVRFGIAGAVLAAVLSPLVTTVLAVIYLKGHNG